MKTNKIALYIRVFSLLLPYTAFITLLSVKLEDSEYSFSWVYAFIPLFVADIAHICGYIPYLWLVVKQRGLGYTWSTNVCFSNVQGELLPVVIFPLTILTKIASEILILLYLLSIVTSFVPCGVLVALCAGLIFTGMTVQSIKSIVK